MRMRRGILVIVGVLAGGCVSVPKPVTNPDAVRFERGTVAVEYMQRNDRYTFFGPLEGPNMLHVIGLDWRPSRNGEYTFYGGCYTWIAPQGGEDGWIDEFGFPLEWPPDPAMDRGPTSRSARTKHSFSVMGPETRRGLRGEKTLHLTDDGGAELAYTLHNDTDKTVTASCWVITACGPRDVLALRAGEMYGWDQASVSAVMDVAKPSGDGWLLIDIRDVKWQGGVKVYMDGPGEIAIWHEGWWFCREQLDTYGGRLRDHGEGPVAAFVQPKPPVIEAQLYGPLVDIPAGGSHTSVERWTLIQAKKRADTSVLPGVVQRPDQEASDG